MGTTGHDNSCTVYIVSRNIPSPGSEITALLGPTNTGKTHRCVSRMLDYDTGMIGLPLRLLAREVYDRVEREVGADHVALITGEERIVPHRPRYWVCTTEAMPVSMDVDFVGVDEIQLAAHPTRGHLFTERLLHARGRFETWFMGANTMREVIAQLVPSARFETAERLSKLSFTGAVGLGQVSGRCAVVAFSVRQVYELAERLRVRKGGVAVVLGALSPKTRNAQVEMYQAGEVDHVVATDAIGMGLNMSISHVALAALHKFDGRGQRGLSAAELAQIAGRAGRSIHDGTFGTLEPTWLDPRVALDIEHHAFPQVRHVMWRNRDVDYSSLDALLDSLQRPPSLSRLRLVNTPTDTETLANLARHPEIRKAVRDAAAVRLLWNVCQIPDYRQLLPDLHAELLRTVFERLVHTGSQLDDAWLAERIRPLSATAGDLDTLLHRISCVRTWSYVCQRQEWIRNAAYWQAETRALEGELSDALHERLLARFVVRRRARVGPQTRQSAASVVKSRPTVERQAITEDIDPHHPFAALKSFRTPGPSSNALESKTVPTIAEPWVLTHQGELCRGGHTLAKLTPGPSVRQPGIHVLAFVSGKERSTIREQALATVKQHVDQAVRWAKDVPVRTSDTRGLVYQLQTGLGAIATRDVTPLLQEMPPDAAALLSEYGVRIGTLSVYFGQSLDPEEIAFRLPLVRAFAGGGPLPNESRLGAVSLPGWGGAPRAERSIALYLGYVAVKSAWVRCDVAEAALAELCNENVTPTLASLTAILGCPSGVAASVAQELAQRAGLPLPELATSRGASQTGQRRRFRRRRYSGKVKQLDSGTVPSQK